MRVLAYVKRTASIPVPEALSMAEVWVRHQGHEPRRLVGHDALPDAAEYPPKDAVVKACRRGLIDAVVVLDLSALGPDLIQTIDALEKSGARVLVVGDCEKPGMDLRSTELRLAVKVAEAVYSEQWVEREVPKRVCPPRVSVAVADIRALQQQGLRLDEIGAKLNASRSTLVRRLKRDRERRAAQAQDQH